MKPRSMLDIRVINGSIDDGLLMNSMQRTVGGIRNFEDARE